MTIGRNDPCLCGSGKKYKKCCMKKENVIQLQEFKIERFYQQKFRLVNLLFEFVLEHISSSTSYQLESNFYRRTKLSKSLELRGLFEFWLKFFYNHENGMRIIEWFSKEMGNKLSSEEREMLQRWVRLKPQMVQAIDQSDSFVVFEDYFTKETFRVSRYHENLPAFVPWYSTCALLEPIDGQYYFNGVRMLASPISFQNAINFIKNIMAETGLNHEQVIIKYYPEIIGALHDEKIDKDIKDKEITQYTYKFTLTDKTKGENFLYNDHDFTINKWEDTEKKLDWLDQIQDYKDSELSGYVQIAEVLASIILKNKTLTFVSTHIEIVKEFLEKVNRAGNVLQLIDDYEEKHTVPEQVDLTHKMASMEKDVPPYFAFYAQSTALLNIDEPIPSYENLSLRDLVRNGKQELAETWLKHSEYNMHRIILQQYGEVPITADYNTVRRELGLNYSPYVTGGENRHSYLVSVTEPLHRNLDILEEDITIYEKLGFSPEEFDNFYTKDIIAFYKEKALGKSDGTERKYRYSLYDIRAHLERSKKKNWDECNAEFWNTFLMKDFYELNNHRVNQTMIKDITSTVKTFVKWLG